MPNRSRINWIIDPIRPEQMELFTLELEKIAKFDFVNTLASTYVNQSAPNFVKMYVTIRFSMSLIMNPIRLEKSELSALYLKNCYN